MKIRKHRWLLAFAVLTLVSGTVRTAQAGLLLDLEDPAGQNNTPYSLNFVAGAPATTLSFGGYQLLAYEEATQISLTTGGGPNLLGGSWVFTPAPSGTNAQTFNDGSSVPALAYGGVIEDSFDVFSQTIATVVGQTYNVSFLFTNSFYNVPSGFQVSASDGTLINTVPEPATVASLGVGLIIGGGALLRRRKAAKLA